MISRYLFVCLYFFSFFLINRWYDLYQYCFHLSTSTAFSEHIIPIHHLNVKQLQYILNLRGITYVNINDKYDLIKMVEQTGAVRGYELSEPIEDHSRRRTMAFSSYKHLLDFVDDCKDTIWFVHLLPNDKYRQSLTHLSTEKWHTIERRLSIFNIQTGVLNCSHNEYSHLCRTLSTERLVLLIPSINRRSTNMYSYELYSAKQYDYQYILKWLSRTLEKHVNKEFDWYELPAEQRSSFELQINTNSYSSLLPMYYFTLLYRYGSTVNFRLHRHESKPCQIKFSLHNSTVDTYIYNDMNHTYSFHELPSYRSLNIFLSHLTVNTQTLVCLYFIVLNIYFLYDIYLVQSLSLLKKILMINLISGLLWPLCLTFTSTERIDHSLQTFAFYLIKFSQQSTTLMFIRNDLLMYSVMSKWILYPMLIVLHVGIGLCFRWYLREKYGRTTNELPNDVIMIDQTHALCSKVWQFVLCFLFSDQGPNEHNNPTLLQYFSQDSFWLDQHSLFTVHPNVNVSSRPTIDFARLPVWRFTIQRRKATHGASEYYSDVELEQTNDGNEQTLAWKKSFIHRRMTNAVSLTHQDNCYTSESDENNNSLTSPPNKLNSSEVYQCSICLEKYVNHVYICTLPCLHHFHRKCLFDWLCNSEHTTCPLCRSPVPN